VPCNDYDETKDSKLFYLFFADGLKNDIDPFRAALLPGSLSSIFLNIEKRWTNKEALADIKRESKRKCISPLRPINSSTNSSIDNSTNKQKKVNTKKTCNTSGDLIKFAAYVYHTDGPNKSNQHPNGTPHRHHQ
jgi:hypothetical protein